MKKTDVVIVGAGQAGLALSHELVRAAVDHVIIERGRIGERWLSQRWPSLRLLTPNWMTRLPGFRYDGLEPHGFMKAREFVGRLTTYAAGFGAPVMDGTLVRAAFQQGSRFRVVTSSETWESRALVIATGACQKARIPEFAHKLPPDVEQISPDTYRRAADLPEGGVLIVGASASGVQFARDVHRSGRPVTLAVGRHVRTPRRYRGKDIMDWLDESGFLTESRPAGDGSRLLRQPSLQLIGDHMGRDLDLPALKRLGVRIVGRMLAAESGTVHLSTDLCQEIEAAEARRRKILDHIDSHIARLGASAPPAADEDDAGVSGDPSLDRIDLRRENIRSVVWATGYRRDYSWLRMPAISPHGEIVQEFGRTPVPGLHVLGLPFMRHRTSSFIDGVGHDARNLAGELFGYLDSTRKLAA